MLQARPGALATRLVETADLAPLRLAGADANAAYAQRLLPPRKLRAICSSSPKHPWRLAFKFGEAGARVVVSDINDALEHAPDKIRINAVGPGFIRTPLVEKTLDAAALKALVFAASLRADSLNRKLAALAARLAEQAGRWSTSRARRSSGEGCSTATQPFDSRHGLLLSASPSLGGGNRGLWALRMPLEHLGARIFPDMFSPAMAHQAFEEGDLADVALRTRFDNNLQAFLSLAEAAKHYPCMKRAWVEFLGEPPGAGADRVDPVPG